MLILTINLNLKSISRYFIFCSLRREKKAKKEKKEKKERKEKKAKKIKKIKSLTDTDTESSSFDSTPTVPRRSADASSSTDNTPQVERRKVVIDAETDESDTGTTAAPRKPQPSVPLGSVCFTF